MESHEQRGIGDVSVLSFHSMHVVALHVGEYGVENCAIIREATSFLAYYSQIRWTLSSYDGEQ